MKEKYIVSYSTGKDSVLALYRAIRLGKDVVGLLVIAHDEEDISWFHDVSLSLIESVSKSLEIPLILLKRRVKIMRKILRMVLDKGKKLEQLAVFLETLI